MKFLLILALLVPGATGADEFQVWGKSDQDSHFVSVPELIGRPEFFMGQPVSVVGVAQFRDGNQPVLRLYATSEDLRNSVPAAVKIGSFARSLKMSPEELALLNGKTLVIEGTFLIFERPKLKPGKKPNAICIGDCGVAGEIVDIVRITTWPP